MKACAVTLVLSLVACQALAGCPFAEQAAADREAGVSRKLKDNSKRKPASTQKPATAPPTPAPATTLKPAAASTTTSTTSTATSTPAAAATTAPAVVTTAPATASTVPATTATPVAAEPKAETSTAPKDCSVKRKFDLVGIYSSVAQAKTCFTAAVSTFKSNWDVDTHSGPCLRAAFHDAGTFNKVAAPAEGIYPSQCGGANGSFRREFEAGAKVGFKEFAEQNGMQGCYNLLWGSKSLNDKIRATPGCSKMTDADLIQIAGYVAVVKAGGAPKDGKGCGFYPGRPDATGYDDTEQLPPAGFDDAQQQALFGAYDFGSGQALFNLNLKETIATLAGAHTIGKARVTPKSPVNVGLGSLSNDPDKFNGVYYTQVMSVDGYKGMNGWFKSDRHGLCDKLVNEGERYFDPREELSKVECADNSSDFKFYYKTYSDNFLKGNDSLFLSKFCQAYQAMGTIGLDVPGDYASVAAEFIIK